MTDTQGLIDAILAEDTRIHRVIGKEIADAILHIIDNKYLAKRMAENCAAAKQINEMPFHLFERIMENRDMEETRK